MRISLLTPTRKRPASMQRLWESALQTATSPQNLEIIFYIDSDDTESIAKFNELETAYMRHPNEDKGMYTSQVRAIIGERIVLSKMWNACQAIANGEVFMHCGDDIIFRSDGWDKIVVDHMNSSPDHIFFVHGRDGIQDSKLGTHGFLHRNWVDTVGYFVPPYFSCDYNDTWLTDVSTMLNRRVYDPRIFTEHMHWAVGKQPLDSTYAETQARGHRDNVTQMYNDMLDKRRGDAFKLHLFITEVHNAKSTEE